MPDKNQRLSIIFPIAAAASIILDQLTKFWVKAAIPLYGSWPETGFFRITHGQNTGAAFGIFQDSRIPLTIISCIGTVVILYIALGLSRRFAFLTWKTSMLALGLILGGTVGNLIDRAFIGHVTDFIKVWEWPDFNIADSSLVVGGILLAWNLIRASSMEGSDGASASTDGK
jgi:signal peptidase II